ncbi:MAG: tripartite tricarboxylate transporter TctB family protein [Faecalibacterium sp.]|nr:tripartite tricarboxylate transporter TctB family protein [Faecalibacterium sp.]
MFFKKYGDIVVGIFFAALGAAMILLAKMLPKSKVMEIGPEFMPTVIGMVILVLALALLFLAVKNFKMHVQELEASNYKDTSDYKRVVLSILLVLVYVLTMKPVGFIITTLVYLFLQMYVLAPEENRTKKDVITLLIIDVVFTFIVFFLFRYGFKIVLPAGIFTINL